MKRLRPVSAPGSRQRGMALMISLIVLVVISILGVVSMRTALFQSRVSINSQVENIAFQGAESGIDAVINEATRQSSGPNGILGDGDPGELNPQDPGHIFSNALLNNPQRVCVTPGGLQVIGDGAIGTDGHLKYVTPCAAVANSNVQVTTIVGPGTGEGASATVESYDVKSGTGVTIVEIRSFAEVPNTNVSTIHVQEWAIHVPPDNEGG